jgi:hypothetical protein
VKHTLTSEQEGLPEQPSCPRHFASLLGEALDGTARHTLDRRGS